MNVPDAVGVPKITTPETPNIVPQYAATPGGRPVGEPMPVAPVVKWVISISKLFTQTLGVYDDGPAVLFGETVKTPLGWVVPFQKPLNAPPYCHEQPLMR